MTEIFTVTIELEDIDGQWWEPELAQRIKVLIESENDDLRVKSIKAKWHGKKEGKEGAQIMSCDCDCCYCEDLKCPDCEVCECRHADPNYPVDEFWGD